MTPPPAGTAPTARVDVTSWTYHPAPPAEVDAALDRKADRVFTFARAVQWATALFLVGLVLPVMLGMVGLLPETALFLGSALLLALSIATALWHQRLRKRTGIPVIAALEEVMEPTADMMSNYQQAFALSAADSAHDDLPRDQAKQLRELRREARRLLRDQRKIARQFIIHSELAAQAERRGWGWLRDRHVRTIGGMVLKMTSSSGSGDDTTGA